MTSVNVSSSTNNVVVTNAITGVVSVISSGPYLNIDGTAKVEGSLVYFDGTQFKADEQWTTSSLTDGGNF